MKDLLGLCCIAVYIPFDGSPDHRPDFEEIELLRGGSVVSSFAGAFGGALRETRLTALLGYLIALEPRPFLDQFGFTWQGRQR